MTRGPQVTCRGWLLLLAAAVLALLCGACFNVDPPQTYYCSAAEPECPPGMSCNGGVCVVGDAADAAVEADTSSDASSDASPDTSPDASPDAPSGDLSTASDAAQEAAMDSAAGADS